MNTTKSKLGYLAGAGLLLTSLACSSLVGKVVPPVAQPVAADETAATAAPANNPAATPVPVSSDGDTTKPANPGNTGQNDAFDPGGALAGADSYALAIDSAQGKITFKVVKSKKEYAVISQAQGVASEMYIKNDTLYTVASGSCVGVGLKSGDIDNLAHMGDFTAFTTGLGEETLVGEEEVNGVKTNHYQVKGSAGSFDIWTAQDGGYMVRLAGQGPAGQVQIDVTDVNAVGEITLPEACANAITLPGMDLN